MPYSRTDNSGYNSQQDKVSRSIQEFVLLEINKVPDILRNVEEIKDRAVIIPKYITENKKRGEYGCEEGSATLPRPSLLRSRSLLDSSSVDQVLKFHFLLWRKPLME
jgi:hypothetical protein